MEGEEEEENEEEQPPGLAKRLMAQHSQKENAANAGNSSKPVGGAGGKSKPPVADVPSAIQPATRSSKPAALVPEQQQGKSLGKRGNGRGKSAPLPANDEQLASGDAHHARPGAKRKSGGDAALDAVPLALSKKNKRSSSPEEHQEEVPGGGGGGETDKRRLWSMKDSRKLETLTAAKMMDRRYRLLTAGAGAGPRVGDRLIPALAG